MAQSGITIDRTKGDEYELFQARTKVNGVLLRSIIFTINSDKTKIIVEKVSSDNDYESFLQEFPEEEPRFAVYNFEYDLGDAGKREKIIFIHWNPTLPLEAPREKKVAAMLFASSKAGILTKLTGIAADFQASELDDISPDEVLRKVAKS